MRREDKGGRVVSLSFPPSLKDLDLGGGGLSTPRPFTAHPVAHRVFSLSLSTHFLIGGILRLLPCRILIWVGITRLTMTAPKTLCKAMSTMKR
jgi:hypothetical protein